MPLLLAVYPTQEERRIQSLVEKVRSKLQWSLSVFPCQTCVTVPIKRALNVGVIKINLVTYSYRAVSQLQFDIQSAKHTLSYERFFASM